MGSPGLGRVSPFSYDTFSGYTVPPCSSSVFFLDRGSAYIYRVSYRLSLVTSWCLAFPFFQKYIGISTYHVCLFCGGGEEGGGIHPREMQNTN